MHLPILRLTVTAMALGLSVGTLAQSQPEGAPATIPDLAEPWPQTTFEIFKLAPGKQEAFIRRVAAYDEVSRAGGQPETLMYFHAGGDDWDVLLLKVPRPKPTPEQEEAMTAKKEELGLLGGPEYFLKMRENVASHVDSKTVGPLTAAQWLAKLDQQRAEQAAGAGSPPGGGQSQVPE